MNDATVGRSKARDSRVAEATVPASLFADWFPQRDELCDLRTQSDLSDADEARVWTLLNELVALADDMVGCFAPDVFARCRITGEHPADVIVPV